MRIPTSPDFPRHDAAIAASMARAHPAPIPAMRGAPAAGDAAPGAPLLIYIARERMLGPEAPSARDVA